MIFFHQFAIMKNYKNKFLKSMAYGNVLNFDIVSGRKNLPEAANIIASKGKCLHGYKEFSTNL